jgi:hypothetical protein
MRFSTPVEYQTISQALLKVACPFCTYLKNFQSKVLHELSDPAKEKYGSNVRGSRTPDIKQVQRARAGRWGFAACC